MADCACPTCTSEALIDLGALGRRHYFRCRQCGMEFSVKVRRAIQEKTPEPPAEPDT